MFWIRGIQLISNSKRVTLCKISKPLDCFLGVAVQLVFYELVYDLAAEFVANGEFGPGLIEALE